MRILTSIIRFVLRNISITKHEYILSNSIEEKTKGFIEGVPMEQELVEIKRKVRIDVAKNC